MSGPRFARCWARGRFPEAPGTPQRWEACCVDLDLWAMGSTWEGASTNLAEAVDGYLEAVYDTEDQASIPRLLDRPAPLTARVRWYWMALESMARRAFPRLPRRSIRWVTCVSRYEW